MEDEPTIEEAKRRLEIAAYEDDEVVPVYAADLRTLLASHASLKEWVKEAKAAAQELRMQAISDMGQYQENFERAEAAESRLASLTGQVESVLALYADSESYRDEYGDLPEHDPGAAAREVLAAIRSLPVFPTTGDGGGPEPEDRK